MRIHFNFVAQQVTQQSSQLESLSGSGGGGDVLCFTVGERHHLLLDRLLADQAHAEEEECPTCALAHVVVADEVRHAGAPWVVQT